MKSFLSLAVGLSALATQAYAMFNNLEEFNADNWQNKVVNDKEHFQLVIFYADWCGYCNPLAEEMESVMNDPSIQDKKIKIGAVDVMQNKKFTKSFGISRSPTIKFFGKDKTKPDNFIGHRTHKELVKYINAYADSYKYVKKQEDKKEEKEE